MNFKKLSTLLLIIAGCNAINAETKYLAVKLADDSDIDAVNIYFFTGDEYGRLLNVSKKLAPVQKGFDATVTGLTKTIGTLTGAGAVGTAGQKGAQMYNSFWDEGRERELAFARFKNYITKCTGCQNRFPSRSELGSLESHPCTHCWAIKAFDPSKSAFRTGFRVIITDRNGILPKLQGWRPLAIIGTTSYGGAFEVSLKYGTGEKLEVITRPITHYQGNDGFKIPGANGVWVGNNQ